MAEEGNSAVEEDEMLKRILETADAESLRHFVRARLRLQPGESVLSIGCGPGLKTASYGEDIGEQGHVHGVDVNEAVLQSARERCADLSNVSFSRGDATNLPVPDNDYDVAVAKQVYQFVPDVETALDELHQVLKPDGRAAIVETDIDGLVIHSSDRDRMQRAIEAYRKGVLHPHLGTRLVSLLPDTGLTVDDIVLRGNVKRELDAQTERGTEVFRQFMEADDSFEQAEIEAWERDLRELDGVGEFLSCGGQFLFIGRKTE